MSAATSHTKTKKSDAHGVSTIVKKAPPPKYDPTDPNSPRPPIGSKKLGGVYRVIHGRIALPHPEGEKPANGEPFLYAEPGDEVMLSDADAERMLAGDLVEPLDAKPSRVRKVWSPPPTKNMAGVASGR